MRICSGRGVVLALAIVAMTPTASAAGAQEPRPWRHLTMDDVDPDLEIFRPVRATYLQLMYDLRGDEEIEYSGLVNLDVEPAIHSGPWDGTAPFVLEPYREPGLLIVWQVQQALYNGFDRVLTDSRLSLKQRVLPSGFTGLRVGFMVEDEHVLINAKVPEANEDVSVVRMTLPEGSVNVLTLPYLLASMDLEAGDRFTLPGYAPIGGPDGTGVAWRGGAWVRGVEDMEIRGERRRVAEILFRRLAEDEDAAPDFTRTDRRMTRLMISDAPPYLLGRADFMLTEDGEVRFVREHLGLVDWAELPLAPIEHADVDLWDIDMEKAEIRLRRDRHPEIVVPLRPSPPVEGASP